MGAAFLFYARLKTRLHCTVSVNLIVYVSVPAVAFTVTAVVPAGVVEPPPRPPPPQPLPPP